MRRGFYRDVVDVLDSVVVFQFLVQRFLGLIPPSPPWKGGNWSQHSLSEGSQSPPFQGGFRGIEPEFIALPKVHIHSHRRIGKAKRAHPTAVQGGLR